MADEQETEEVVIDGAYAHDLDLARRGLRTCLSCRTSFPNRLAVVKHQLHGCRKAPSKGPPKGKK